MAKYGVKTELLPTALFAFVVHYGDGAVSTQAFTHKEGLDAWIETEKDYFPDNDKLEWTREAYISETKLFRFLDDRFKKLEGQKKSATTAEERKVLQAKIDALTEVVQHTIKATRRGDAVLRPVEEGPTDEGAP